MLDHHFFNCIDSLGTSSLNEGLILPNILLEKKTNTYSSLSNFENSASRSILPEQSSSVMASYIRSISLGVMPSLFITFLNSTMLVKRLPLKRSPNYKPLTFSIFLSLSKARLIETKAWLLGAIGSKCLTTDLHLLSDNDYGVAISLVPKSLSMFWVEEDLQRCLAIDFSIYC